MWLITKVHMTMEYKIVILKKQKLSWIISVINEAKITKFGTHLAKDQSQETLSHIYVD